MRSHSTSCGLAFAGAVFLSGLLAASGPGVAPRAIVAWASGPLEARVAFDRPVDPALARGLVGGVIRLDSRYRRVGESRDAAPPPTSSHGSMRIAAVRRDDGGRTLVLATDPHPSLAVYTLTIPGGKSPGSAIRYDLGGVSAEWDDGREGSAPAWSGWLPSLDLDASREATRGSSEHEKGFALLAKPGRLTLSTLLVLPAGRVTLRFASAGVIDASLGGEAPEAQDKDGVRFSFDSTGDMIDLAVTLRTGGAGAHPTLRATYRVGDGSAEHPLGAEHQFVPSAPSPSPAPTPAPAPPYDLSGGDARRGEAVFFGEQAKCSQCHAVRGRGGAVGPDLGVMAGRPRREVYREIAEPGATIHPDFVAYILSLKDGRVLAGIVRADGAEAIRVTDTDAKTTRVRRDEVEAIRQSSTSIMPVGLAAALGEEKMRDLLAFLAGPVRGAPAVGTPR